MWENDFFAAPPKFPEGEPRFLEDLKSWKIAVPHWDKDILPGAGDLDLRGGFTVDRSCVYYGDRRYKSGCEFGSVIAEMPPEKRFSAVFSTTGLMAAGMVDTLRGYGLRVPDDISVICNDDYSRSVMYRR